MKSGAIVCRPCGTKTLAVLRGQARAQADRRQSEPCRRDAGSDPDTVMSLEDFREELALAEGGASGAAAGLVDS